MWLVEWALHSQLSCPKVILECIPNGKANKLWRNVNKYVSILWSYPNQRQLDRMCANTIFDGFVKTILYFNNGTGSLQRWDNILAYRPKSFQTSVLKLLLSQFFIGHQLWLHPPSHQKKNWESRSVEIRSGICSCYWIKFVCIFFYHFFTHSKCRSCDEPVCADYAWKL